MEREGERVEVKKFSERVGERICGSEKVGLRESGVGVRDSGSERVGVREIWERENMWK